MNLPTNKRELYEECCKMLIEKRDIERGIDSGNINLNYEQKKVILAQLAYWMMKNNYVEVAKKEAVKSVKRSISGMSVSESVNIERKIFKYLCSSNAGDNSVVLYSIDENTGMLTKILCLPISGDYPKDAALFPDSRHLVSLNHETNSMTFFDVNMEEGTIVMNGPELKVDRPNCIIFYKLK